MVPACKQKFSAAGNGADFSDFQLIAVDGVMIEYVVRFKLPRVMDEVVVYGVIANLDIRAGHDLLQINDLPVMRTGIALIRHLKAPPFDQLPVPALYNTDECPALR